LGDARFSPHLSVITLGCLYKEMRGVKDRVAILRLTTSVIMSTSCVLGVDNRVKEQGLKQLAAKSHFTSL